MLLWVNLLQCRTHQEPSMISAYDPHRAPTAGGQYHWVAMLAPPGSHKILSYMTGTALMDCLLKYFN